VAPFRLEPPKPKPKRRHRFRKLSILLLFVASMANSIAVFAATEDMQRAERDTELVLREFMQPREYLYQQAEAKGLDARLLDRIAHCESNWRMVSNSGSSAYGFFQIIDATEKSTPQFKAGSRKFDPFTNIDMAVYLFERYGAFPWTESQGCWWWYQ
jgi:soluble lytic murein transglycosylase-like protein